jgi:hypothetical protein
MRVKEALRTVQQSLPFHHPYRRDSVRVAVAARIRSPIRPGTPKPEPRERSE